MYIVAELQYAYINHAWVRSTKQEAEDLFKQIVLDNYPDCDNMSELLEQGYHEDGEYTIQILEARS